MKSWHPTASKLFKGKINNMDEKTEKVKPNETDVIRDDKGLFQPGTAPGPGAPKQTEEEKEAKRIKKEMLEKIKEDYKNDVIERLPKVSPALMEKAEAGDIQAIKEVHSLIFGNKTIMVGGDEGDEPIKVKQIYDGKSISGYTSNQESIPAEESN